MKNKVPRQESRDKKSRDRFVNRSFLMGRATPKIALFVEKTQKKEDFSLMKKQGVLS